MNKDSHKNVYDRLEYFIKIKKIPNLIFHGASGSGKRTILYNFISNIYENDKQSMKKHTMFVDCAHGKGIKFIREELKFFAKTNINCKNGNLFKSIILLSADKLTIDAQSALRRCIELFSHNTRFFIVVEDKFKLLRPILSRFCDIYIPNPLCNGNPINLHKNQIMQTYNTKKYDVTRKTGLKKLLSTKTTCLFSLAEKFYEKGYSGIDLIEYISETWDDTNSEKHKILLFLHKIKRDFRNEKVFIYLVLNFLLIRSELNLENILFI
tara:strand:+ start:8726 stop:9526 length:801 start_codon:yes stop_codon:yes gene_type:complete